MVSFCMPLFKRAKLLILAKSIINKTWTLGCKIATGFVQPAFLLVREICFLIVTRDSVITDDGFIAFQMNDPFIFL